MLKGVIINMEVIKMEKLKIMKIIVIVVIFLWNAKTLIIQVKM
jgi:hypothetical protein